ncbi:MAG: ergothioneine biosynthesis protein EgtB [Actinobacteria bacterium]|nr:ergothioneine biosynthesis protein EgtB [Actinomycetota bacterium]
MRSRVDGVLAVMGETRERTLALVRDMTEEQLSRVVTPLLSPLIWDLGHIANFEQRWLLGSDDAELDAMFNPFKQPRAVRGKLPLPTRDECFAYMTAVRDRVAALESAIDPYRAELVIQHEQQHNETMLQMLRMMDDYAPPKGLWQVAGETGVMGAASETDQFATETAVAAAASPEWIEYPAGGYLIGATAEPGAFAYDNEQSAHTVMPAAFAIASRPVLNREYRQWVEGGGYRNLSDWSPAGREWLKSEGATAPLHWLIEGGQAFERGFGEPRPLLDDAPVIHVSWFEADAFARAHGARLPSEFEWEVAASYDPATGPGAARRRHPWGDGQWRSGLANLDQRAFGTVPVGVCAPTGAPSDMAGQVWEWTSSEFAAYPGFSPFCYEQYSAPFFDQGYRVLRGGSWATRARSVDNRFRNWDLPQRRQIFSGLRLARDA